MAKGVVDSPPSAPQVAAGVPVVTQTYPQQMNPQPIYMQQINMQPMHPQQMNPQPMYPQQMNPQPTYPQVNEWSTDLFACLDDPNSCLITLLCPCITFGQISEIVDRGSTSCGTNGVIYGLIYYLSCLQWIYSFTYRPKMRSQYMLAESPCPDILVHCFCEACALCQEYRELQIRGFDMNLGWSGNMQRMGGGGVQMSAPPMQGGMYR